jgi:hypothetical protein
VADDNAREEAQADSAEDLELSDGAAADIRGGAPASKDEIYKKKLEQGPGHDFWDPSIK